MTTQPRPKTVTYHFDTLTATIDYTDRTVRLENDHDAFTIPFQQLGVIRAVFQAIGHQMPEYGSER